MNANSTRRVMMTEAVHVNELLHHNIIGRTMNVTNVIRIFLLVVVCLHVAGCSDGESPTRVKGTRPGFGIASFGIPETADVVGTYDTTNVRALVTLTQEYSNLFDHATLAPIPTETYHQARVTYHEDIPLNAVLGDVLVNTNSIGGAALGMLNSFATPSFSLPFGGSPIRVQKVSDTYFGNVDTNLSFQSPVRLTSLSLGTIIQTANALPMTISNPGSGWLNVAISVDTVIGSSANKTVAHAWWVPASGSISISQSELGRLAPGRGVISVAKYEPVFLTTSTGQKIAVVAESKHSIGVVIQ